MSLRIDSSFVGKFPEAKADILCLSVLLPSGWRMLKLS